MSSFDTFTEDVDADNLSGYGGYTTGFPAGGDDYTGTGHFSTDDGDVPVATSPGIFGFEDPNSESNYDAVHVGGNGHSAFESDGVFSTDGPMLPPPSEMEPEEGYALREWRRWDFSFWTAWIFC